VVFWFTDFNKEIVAKAFFRFEIENELRRLGLDFAFENDTLLDEVLPELEKRRCDGLYNHQASEYCEQRACGKLWALDGIWKTTFQICAFEQKVSLSSQKAAGKNRKHEN
jgi:hypothetical protein